MRFCAYLILIIEYSVPDDTVGTSSGTVGNR